MDRVEEEKITRDAYELGRDIIYSVKVPAMRELLQKHPRAALFTESLGKPPLVYSAIQTREEEVAKAILQMVPEAAHTRWRGFQDGGLLAFPVV